MVKLTFEFDKSEIKKAGLTEDELLADVRKYAKENDIAETAFGVFEKDGEDALAMLVMIGVETLRKDLAYMKYVKTLELDVDGEKEDCKESVQKWLNRERIPVR